MNIFSISPVFWEMIEKPDEKKNKKVVDKQKITWYYIRVASESNNKVPWQINSNATLKIPKFSEYDQTEVMKIITDWIRTNVMKITTQNNSKIQIACRLNGFGWQRCQKDDLTIDAVMDGQFLTGEDKTFKHESLILAQDERWRRA